MGDGRILIVLCLGMLVITAMPAIAGEWVPLYHSDFPSDPGWVTDQPANYYWVAGSYRLISENRAPSYVPNRYAYVQVPYGAGGFVLTWDMVITRIDWSAGISFGLFDINLVGCGGRLNDSQSAHLDFSRVDRGLCLSLAASGSGSEVGHATTPGGAFSANVWYTCVLEYDQASQALTTWVTKRDTGNLVWTASVPVEGGFADGLHLLGSSRYPMGQSGYSGVSASAIAEGYIDNVTFSTKSASPNLSTVSADPSSVIADGGNSISVTVTLLDEDGNPVPGRRVQVYTSRGAADRVTQPAALTDAAGTATATLTSLVAGTSLVRATDATDGITLAQSAQVIFSEGIPSSGQLRAKIDLLHGASLAGFSSLVGVAPEFAGHGDFFQQELTSDMITAGLHAIINGISLGTASAAMQAGKPAMDYTVSGIVDSKVPRAVLDKGADGLLSVSYRVVVGKETASAVAQSAVLDGSTQILSELVKKSALKIAVNNIADGLASELTKAGFSMDEISDYYTASVSSWTGSIGDIHDGAASGIPVMSEARQAEYATDLGMRALVPAALANKALGQADLLEELRSAKDQAGHNAWLLLVAKVGIGIGASVAADGAGAVAAAAVNAGIDAWVDSETIQDDQWGYQMSLAGLSDLFNSERTIVSNEISGYSRIMAQLPPQTGLGEIGSITNISEGNGTVALTGATIWEERSYSDLEIRNTSSTTNTYLVLVSYNGQAHLYGTVSRDLPLSGETAAVNVGPGESKLVRVYYLGKNQERISPRIGSDIVFNVLANNKRGTFYLGSKVVWWDPTYRPLMGARVTPAGGKAALLARALEAGDVKVVENPIYMRVTPLSDSQYEARIFVSNPLEMAIDAQITQPIPPDITIVATDGTVSDDGITWMIHVEAESVTSVRFTVYRSLPATGPLVLAPAQMAFTEPGSGEDVHVTSNVPGGLLPLCLTRLRVALDLRPGRYDLAVLTGTISADQLPGAFSPSGPSVTLNVGGVSGDFVLDAKGKGRDGANSFSLQRRKSHGKPVWLWVAKLKLDANEQWAACGLTDETVRKKPVIVPVQISLNGTSPQSFYAEKTLHYTAKAGRLGSAH